MLTIRLLGGFEVQLNGARLEISSRAAQTLLAYLLLPPGKAHRRERLAGLLWPNSPETNAHNSLRQALWYLGRALGPASARLVVADRVTVQADPNAFHRLDVASLQAPLPPDAPVEALAERVAVYEGELLPGFYDDWVVVERERLQALYERQMTELLRRLEQEERWHQVLEWGERWIALGHAPEPAFQSVMRAHAALGQAATALRAFQRCREALQLRLGLEPSEKTRTLYRQILQASGMLAPVPEEPAGRPPPPAPEPAAAPLEASESPYKGLHHFSEVDARLYFGREKLIEELLAYLRHHHFLAVVGASGSGKSSLVRAGLVPALRLALARPAGDAAGGAGWPVRILTPGRNPLESLAAGLAGEAAPPAAVAALAAELGQDMHALRAHTREQPGPLVVVDQFEELFTLCRDEAARRAFIANLLNAADPQDDESVRVIITLRADFYGHCGSYAELRTLLESHQYYIGPMTAAELRRAIELPAQQAGLTFQTGLVELILRDVGDEPGALPLLSHALLETWKRRSQQQLALSAYAAAGGVHGAIARTAEHVYQDLPPKQQALARHVFLQLTELGQGTEATRRRVALSELLAPGEAGRAMRAVLQVLADARLIIINAETVEVAHEALIREWPALQTWLAEDREGLRLHRRLAEAAQAWDALGRAPDELYRGGRLDQALEWWQAHPQAPNALEAEFLRAAQGQLQREQAERQAQQARELEAARRLAEAEKGRAEQEARAAQHARRWQAALGVSALVVAVLGVLALAFGIQRQAAVQVAQANLARSEAQRLAAEADALLQSGGDAQLIALLAISSLNLQYSPEADAVLGKALLLNYPTLSLEGHTNSLRDAAYSPDGQYIVTAGNDMTAHLWRTDTGEQVRSFQGHTAPVTSVAYSADGRWVLTGGEDGTARLWEAATGQPVTQFAGHTALVLSVGLSPDGQWAVTAGDDDSVCVWSTATGEQLGASLPVASESVAVSPDGTLILTGSRGGEGLLWEWPSGQLVARLAGHTGRVIEVAFAPDGRQVATASVDTTVRLWDVATGAQRLVLAGHSAGVFGVAFSPDGRQVVTAGEDRHARLWDTATGRELGQFNGHSATVADVAFAPDGRHFVTAGTDGLALVWDVNSSGPAHTLTGHGAQLWNALFSPDGRYLVTASVDKTARLWDVQTRAQVRQFLGHTGEVWGLAYSRDGRWLVTGGYDGTVRLWDTATGAEVRQFMPASGRVMTGVALSPDGRYVAAGDEGAVAYIWELESGALVRTLRGHTSGLNLLAYSPDGRVLATTSSDSTARLWSAETGEVLHTLAGHSAFVSAVAFAPDGRYVATASGDGTVIVWDAATGAQVRRLTGHSELVWSVAYAPDGRSLATASADGTARLWEAETGRELRRFAGHTAGVQAVAVAPDGQLIATASDDGTARLWDIDYHAAVARLCARLLRDLTPEERQQHGLAGAEATCPE